MKTPTATIGIRGTTYFVKIRGLSVIVWVTKGKVKVVNKAGETLVLPYEAVFIRDENTAPLQTDIPLIIDTSLGIGGGTVEGDSK